MNRISFFLGGGLIATASLFGVAFAHDGAHKETDSKPTTIIGELIDTACFVASDGDAKGKDHAECAAKCLGSGVPAGILPEGKGHEELLFLLTNPVVLSSHAGQTVKAEGTVSTAHKAIDVKKLFVKDGEEWKEIQLKDEHHKMGGDEEKKDDGHQGHKH